MSVSPMFVREGDPDPATRVPAVTSAPPPPPADSGLVLVNLDGVAIWLVN